MGPAAVVGLLEGTIPRGTELAANARGALLGLALATVPGSRRHSHNPVACLVHCNRTVLAVTVDERVLRPPPLVRTNTAAAHHLLHIVQLELFNLDKLFVQACGVNGVFLAGVELQFCIE